MKIVQGIYRNNLSKTVDGILKIEDSSWEGEMKATEEETKSRLEVFSKGLWSIWEEDEMQAYIYSIKINEETICEDSTWNDLCDDGYGRNHIDKGDTLFGITLGALKSHYGKTIFEAFVKGLDNGAYEGVKRIYACSRIPSLHKYFKHKDDVNIDKHNKIISKDPTVRLFYSMGFYPVKFSKDSFAVDHYSLGYGLLVARDIAGYKF